MNRQQKNIQLSKIRLETNFRNEEKDLSLELDINKNGLKMPLVVEKESEDVYILVDGYRRFYALEFLEEKDAECTIEKLSSEEDRLIKRLNMELHTKKRTTYQLERMIKQLLQNKRYNVKRIANLCNVTKATIAKYIRGSNVNPEWLRRGEKAGVGRHAFTIIHELDISEDTKNDIASRYINGEINKNDVDRIKKTVSDKTFKNNITEEAVNECINQIIECRPKDSENVKEVVNENSLLAKYTKSSHLFMHNLILEQLTKVERILSNHIYTDNLSKAQKSQLRRKLLTIDHLINPSIEWHSFPKESYRTFKSRKRFKHD